MSNNLKHTPPDSQPHDRFFKCLLEEVSIARDLLERYLPPLVLKHIDLNHLEWMPNEGFVEQKLLVDVVWQSRLQNTNDPIYVLLEHQSTYDTKLARRLRHYMWMLSDRLLEGKETEPVPVVAIVFYHGSQANVPSSLNLAASTQQLIVAPGVSGLAATVPIVNYQQLSWQEIPPDRPASMLEYCLKAYLDPRWDYLQMAMEHLQLHGNLAPKTIREIHRYLLVHIQVHQSPLEVFHRITQFPYFTPQGDKNMATLAEWISKTTPEMLQQQWLQEGRHEGRQEGREEGHIQGLQVGLEQGHIQGLQVGLEQGNLEGQLVERRKIIQRLLAQGMSPKNIASLTGYTLEEILQQSPT